MKEWLSRYWDVVIVAVAVIVACILIAPRSCTGTYSDVVVQHDTVVEYLRDTLTIERDVVITQYRYDTIVVNDTVYIADVPQVYTDSTDDYRLQVRAVKMYDYRLDLYRDSIITRINTEIAPMGKKSGKFGQSVVIGIQAGYGIGIAPATMQAQFLPYIGIGITYGIGYNW